MNTLIKYPRTFHLPWSKGFTSDDKVLKSIDCFKNKEVVVTEKYDGENCTMYSDYIHARSLDSKHHPSRDWVKQFHAQIKQDIPDNFRICGENLYAQHSIYYDNLPSYFICFSIWNEEECLDWEETLQWASLLGLQTPNIIYSGIFDENKIKEAWTDYDENNHEGYVVRVKNSFNYNEFSNNVAKYVRENHVVTDEHWMFSDIKPNKLKI